MSAALRWLGEVMLEGPPGSGKSTLALALIDRGAILVGDDGVTLETRDGQLWAHPPPNIAGKLEIRGVGIVDVTACAAPLALVLSHAPRTERLPEYEELELDGAVLPRLHFDLLAPSAAMRAEWALRLHGRLETM